MARRKPSEGSKKSKQYARVGVLDLFVVFGLLVFGVNFIVQVLKKPNEIFALAGLGETRSISETWQSYAHLFREHSTPIMRPAFLAAMAQVESSGNPFATPEWRFRWAGSWSKLFSPASSSVGLYQFTDGTFEQARKYCVSGGRVLREGPWYDLDSCWFNWGYFRAIPSHSIEMTSAYLHSEVVDILRGRIKSTSHRDQKRLAAVIHLCGREKGERLARAKINWNSLGTCGSHSASDYVRKIENYERRFLQISSDRQAPHAL